MRSIRTQLISIIFVIVLGVFLLFAWLSISFVGNMVNEDTNREMAYLAGQSTVKLNLQFESIERAVSVLEKYVRTTVDTDRLQNDSAYGKEFQDTLSLRCKDLAKVTGDVVTVYVRANPEKYVKYSGVFLTADGLGDYQNETLTDVLAYDETDREHVGWYYEPKNKGQAMWMTPYINENINIYMISYVIPIYIKGEFFGVCGMDVNMSNIHSAIDSINYHQGQGFLIDDTGNIIYHKDFPEGLEYESLDSDLRSAVDFLLSDKNSENEVTRYSIEGREQRLIGSDLENGMILGISVPQNQVTEPLRKIWIYMTVSGLILLLVLFLVAHYLMVRIIRPLQALTKASEGIAKGELDVSIDDTATGEIGDLAKSIHLMAGEIAEYFKFVRSQAYQDAMTGVGNKAAYLEAVHILDRKIREGMADFSVAVFDVNGLKKINDQQGHEMGDILIADAASALVLAFGGERIYRIGGDEFAALLENAMEADVELMFQKFDRILEEFNAEGTKYGCDLTIAKGSGSYIPGQDHNFQTVFSRADEMMYKDKKKHYETVRA